MTREEAIQEIEGIFENVYGLSVRERDALETAIDALRENESLARSVNEASELLRKKRPQGECNQCRYYDGVHDAQGHAPCWHWNIGGVMWNDYCSRFEKGE